MQLSRTFDWHGRSVAWERLDRPHVVAHDYGGAVSLRAHLLHGAAYASLALVDVVALEAYISGASHRGLTSEQLAGLTGPWLTDEGRPAFYRQIAAADQRFTDEVEDRYAEMTMPVLVVWGREDTWISVDRAHRLAQLIPAAELEIIDGAGHLIQYDAPVELATSLQRWLSRQS